MEVLAFDVADAALRDRFFALGEELLARDASRAWVDPAELRRQVEAPYLGPGSQRLFLVADGGRDLARCVALVNPDLRAPDGTPVGAIGQFEARPEEAAVQALLDAAVAWLKGRGLSRVWGPFNGSIWHAYRFMTRGQERDPFLGEPRNPPHYPELFQRAGFAPAARWFSWDLAAPHLEGMRAAAAQMRKAGITQAGYRYHPFDLAAFDRELERVHGLLSEGFSENLGFTPIPLAEFRALFGPMRSVIIPGLAPLVTGPGDPERPVGFGYVFPDLAPTLALARAERRALDPAFVRDHPPRRLVFHTMVSLKSERGRGLVEWGLAELMDHVAELGFQAAVGALAKEGPTIYHKTGQPSREYTLFAREA